MATFGVKVRQLRHGKRWSLRDLSEKVGVGFTYLSRVENERLNFGDYPSDSLIHRLAVALEADDPTGRVVEPRARRVSGRTRGSGAGPSSSRSDSAARGNGRCAGDRKAALRQA